MRPLVNGNARSARRAHAEHAERTQRTQRTHSARRAHATHAAHAAHSTRSVSRHATDCRRIDRTLSCHRSSRCAPPLVCVRHAPRAPCRMRRTHAPHEHHVPTSGWWLHTADHHHIVRSLSCDRSSCCAPHPAGAPHALHAPHAPRRSRRVARAACTRHLHGRRTTHLSCRDVNVSGSL